MRAVGLRATEIWEQAVDRVADEPGTRVGVRGLLAAMIESGPQLTFLWRNPVLDEDEELTRRYVEVERRCLAVLDRGTRTVCPPGTIGGVPRGLRGCGRAAVHAVGLVALPAADRLVAARRAPDPEPPFLIVHGALDTLVLHREARSFADQLRVVSEQPVVYAELPATQHNFDFFPHGSTPSPTPSSASRNSP